MEHNEIFEKLIRRIKEYHPSTDLSRVEKAFIIAQQAHGTQIRKSGEPYIIHPLSVAYILADLELDIESIVAGILHDVIEDTEYEYKDIEMMFGSEVADIVEGVTKLENIEVNFKSNQPEDDSITFDDIIMDKARDKNYREELQAENYRKMFIAMAKDIRVILIKIADRLHNMRTLKHMSAEKQKEKAQETLDIYCPLAHRLGISKLRNEMEDLSFRYLNADAYFDLADKVSRKQSERQAYIQKIVSEISSRIHQNGIEATVDGRPKHFFSIYRKMKRQDKTLDQIYDLFAVRIIVNDHKDCYECLGVVHEMYTPIPGRFKDYIAMPKPNMYQSLHTVIIGPEGEPVEVQMRTREMHRTAEYGIAAHWRYKEGMDGKIKASSEEEKLTWLRQILEWQKDLSDNHEFLDAIKVDLNVFADHVYCFTPKGEIIGLSRGSTPIDFAYAIHTAIGNKMIGARVNGKIVTFNFQLNSGDRVEIITSQNSKGPSADWLSIAKTTQAKSKINQWFKKQNKEENILKGREALEKEAARKGYALSDLLSDERKRLTLNKFSLNGWDALCAVIGYGGLKEGQVINRLVEERLKENEKNRQPELLKSDYDDAVEKRHKRKSGITVRGIGDIDVRFSKCCSPVPGDEIVGFVTRGRGVSIHRSDCVNILNMDEIDRQRLIDAEWRMYDKDADNVTYRAEIKIVSENRLDMLTDISRVISEERIPVQALNARTANSGATAIYDIGLLISSRTQLERVNKRLLNLPGVRDIDRAMS
ncbi:MAG: bifunctional (p)ppGpp synthetase/guanosine-3',5'-bis(diphosphate) 3'-pyrophosphohydrolase [Clostridiales bacterium]|nr:bifunctional (p)ppGpp synthetase/guanosine-3',5'-bis(diphosphate) 3'-pyrophosphohydrolase [Clostridiales bacterium]